MDVGRDAARSLRGARALLLDMDGVLVSRRQPIPGAGLAVARLHEAAIPFCVITNTSLWSRSTLADGLRRGGIAVGAERIVTALSATMTHLGAAIPGGAVYLLGSAHARAEFAASDLRLLANEQIDAGAQADAVVIGDSEDELTYENLNRAFRQLRGGAAFVAMHRNPWWLTAAGPTLDSGALVVGLEYATERRATVAGKPSPTIFLAALAQLAEEVAGRSAGAGARLRRAEVAMVGDDPATDLAPARRLGLRTVLVLTGKYRPDATKDAGTGPRRFVPDAIVPSVAEAVGAVLAAGRE